MDSFSPRKIKRLQDKRTDVNQCFIFIKYSNEEGCLSLVLGSEGEIEAPLGERSYAEIKELQNNAKTMVIISTEQASLHFVEMPWLPDKKSRAAIPFALEEKVADNLSNLHFAYDRTHYQEGRYLVIVCNKNYLDTVITTLDSLNIKFDNITLDWFALSPQESCILENNILVYDETRFCGSLAEELGHSYLKSVTEEQKLYTFPNSFVYKELKEATPATIEICEIDPCVWVAKRLQVNKSINLAQGELSHGNEGGQTKRLIWLAVGLGLLWFITVLFTNSIHIVHMNRQISVLDENIATVYRNFFPDAKQVISPKFRIGQLLKSQKNGSDRSFWGLLNTLSLALKQNTAEIQQIQFSNKTMQVTLMIKDFDKLEALQTALKKSVQVKQTEATSKDDKVMAILELRL